MEALLVRPLKDFSRLDPALFRAFQAAAETLNFTRAAQRVAMTQSGVSQHIARLEEMLEVPLFKRSSKAVILTKAGRELAAFVDAYLESVDQLWNSLRREDQELVGKVTYAMPGSCLLSPHLSMMLERRKNSPKIELEVMIRPNAEVISLLLRGEADFGFLTTTVAVPGLKQIPFCYEEYILVGPEKKYATMLDAEKFTRLPFVAYPGLDVYAHAWQCHHLPEVRRPLFDALNVVSSIESVQGALAMVKGQVGYTILPRHCAQHELDRGTVFEYKSKTNSNPLVSRISIATLASCRLPRRAQQVIDWFLEMHPEVDHRAIES
jgi:DNA-binding transcriptional LysR family regulator